MFATAETGEIGRFLGTDPSYSHYDEAIIENLELPFQVVFSGSEASTVAELDARFAAEEPILMYWWTPTAAVAAYDLVNVTLPEYAEECYADPAAIDCDYPEDVLTKYASAQLAEKAPNVQSFLEKFTITTEDQLSMLPAVEIRRRGHRRRRGPVDRDNEDVWSAWLADQYPRSRVQSTAGRRPRGPSSLQSTRIAYPRRKRRFDPQLAGAQEMRLKRRDG